jgi:hypothetical protein
MSDARLKPEWLHSSRMKRLLVHERWAYVAALMWCAGEENDGVIPGTHLDLTPDGFKEAIDVYVNLDLLKKTKTGWAMTPGGDPWWRSQITKKQAAQYAEGNRRRQARYRAKRAGESGDPSA